MPIFRTIFQPLIIAIALALVLRGALSLYSIPSSSMAPELRPGDRIAVTSYFRGIPERGHVVVFRSPDRPGEVLVKRIVAVPGDLIDTRLGRVRIGGHTLPEPYLQHPAESGAIQTQLVPADSFFVLGDNRRESIDSRRWGAIPRHLILGRARLVLWSGGGEAEKLARASDGREGAEPVMRSSERCLTWIR